MRNEDRKFWATVITAVRAAIDTTVTLTSRKVNHGTEIELSAPKKDGTTYARRWRMDERPLTTDVTSDFARVL